jgi:hypothetical protein
MMPLLVVAVMSQLVFSGGMIPVTGRIVLDQLSWITPARWGFASSASTVALCDLVPPPITPADVVGPHVPVVGLRHGDARRVIDRVPRLRALEDPPQGG